MFFVGFVTTARRAVRRWRLISLYFVGLVVCGFGGLLWVISLTSFLGNFMDWALDSLIKRVINTSEMPKHVLSTKSTNSHICFMGSDNSVPREENNLCSASLYMKDHSQKSSWMIIVDHLRKDPHLLKTFRKYLNVLSVSKEILNKFRHIPPAIQQYIDCFESANCLRAISVLEDLTDIKKNPYKFMFEGLTLGKAIDLLINESTYLLKSLSKIDPDHKIFFKLVTNWIGYVFAIHRVVRDARGELRHQILVRVALLNNLNDPVSPLSTAGSQSGA
jgi:hypothetical protein